MIISTNRDAELPNFERLLRKSQEGLLQYFKENPKEIPKNKGINFESLVTEIMNKEAQNTPFEGTIEKVSGLKFPDIIADNYFGVEVKTSATNHWQTTGNSVFEYTCVDSVERIFLLYAKMNLPELNIDIKFKRYEDCLSDIVVTHSPRYKIDMQLNCNETIFNKINISYEKFRKSENPISPIVEYYKKNLKVGQKIWWIHNELEPEANSKEIVIKFWNELSLKQKDYYKKIALGVFPEILGNSSTKYNNFAHWMINQNNIIVPNVRDLFSAGGKINLVIIDKKYLVSKTVYNLHQSISFIYKNIRLIPDNVLMEYWEIEKLPEVDERPFIWLEKILKVLGNFLNDRNINVEKYKKWVILHYFKED